MEVFRWPKSRGLSGLDVVVSDAHKGLVEAQRRCFPGSQLAAVSDSLPAEYPGQDAGSLERRHARGPDGIFEAKDPDAAREQFHELARTLEGKTETAIDTLEAGLDDAIAVLRLPVRYRRRLRTTDTAERLIQELRRREKVIRIFANDESAWRLLGAYAAETHEDGSTGRRNFRMDEYFESRAGQAAEQPLTPAA